MPSPVAGAPAGTDSFEIDLTGVESSGLIPEGAYRARCVEVRQDVSKGGNPMFVWDFELTEGAGKGRILKTFTAITPAAMWKVAETVIAMGVGQTGEVVKFGRSDVVGKECGVVVADSEYNGTVRSQIQRVVSLHELDRMRTEER
jgi:hypothetical protein